MTNASQLREFASRYTAAWCSHNPVSVAAFFQPGGSLSINGGAPAVGRAAIAEAARSFMAVLPDLRVTMNSLVIRGDRVEYHWTLEGRNSGPGGRGNRVRVSGFEEWKVGQDGLIAQSQGHFDAGEYQRQIDHESGTG
jgi:SnoaL-like protein